ncbi:mRNA-decapping enzyme 1A [Anopheles ziemanni]|uniref:mRNA-decapping enzyme 1A n=1 Tax=Anopheles coustani TaxID=139045 RepID=UPI002658E683|nr:mRNA-decapping enzyme 1A [Anopheles coustani]XP_058126369.1 mRNA-decapping enzyme 1A [Anopheles coustani]XP_058171821.1 mRNA-decapping enzyme 1A [Anopheles ziemanni]
MADQTELRMNLVAIKRVDPYAKDIVNSSAHVAFYVFNNAENEWEKTDIEGALFIYSRFAEPYHSIFINNRLNTNSLVEPIRGQIELQSKPPFLLYRNERSRIRGFWFYNNSECDRIGEVIQKLVTECAGEAGGEAPRPVMNGGPTGGPPATDIFSMLTKAQEDFQNNSTNPAGSKPMLDHPALNQQAMMANNSGMPAIVMTAQQQQQHQQQQQQHQQQQQISSQSAPRSVMNFFAAAKQPAASEVPRFKTHAPVHTLEQIEKQHRASTPLKDAGGGGVEGKITPDVSELESSFKRMGIPIVSAGGSNGGMLGNGPQTPSGVPELGTSPLATFLSAANLSGAMRAAHQPVVPKTKLIEISELESRQNQQQQQQQQTPLHELLKKSEGTAGPGATVVKPALMPPTMFKPSSQGTTLGGLFPGSTSVTNSPSTATNVSVGGNGTPGGAGHQKQANNAQLSATATPGSGKNQSKSVSTPGNRQQRAETNSGNSAQKGTPTSTTTTAADLLAKAASKTNNNLINNNISTGGNGSGVEPLTQNQLIQAVSYLIKHDPDFVRKLHEAYVKSFTEMISN